jgi:hypothetical protein
VGILEGSGSTMTAAPPPRAARRHLLMLLAGASSCPPTKEKRGGRHGWHRDLSTAPSPPAPVAACGSEAGGVEVEALMRGAETTDPCSSSRMPTADRAQRVEGSSSRLPSCPSSAWIKAGHGDGCLLPRLLRAQRQQRSAGFLEFHAAATPPRFLRRRPLSLPGQPPPPAASLHAQRQQWISGGCSPHRPPPSPLPLSLVADDRGGRIWRRQAELHGEAAAAARAPLLLGLARGNVVGAGGLTSILVGCTFWFYVLFALMVL